MCSSCWSLWVCNTSTPVGLRRRVKLFFITYLLNLLSNPSADFPPRFILNLFMFFHFHWPTSAHTKWLTSLCMSLPGKESTCNAGDPGSVSGSGSSLDKGIGYPLQYSWASLVVQTVKNLPAVQETWVQSLDWEDPLKKGMATHCSILAWRIPWAEEPGGLQHIGSQRVRHHRASNTITFSL